MSMGNEVYLTKCIFRNRELIPNVIWDICDLFDDDLDYVGENGKEYTWNCALEDGYDTSKAWLIDSAIEMSGRCGLGDVVDYIIEEYFSHNTNYYDSYNWDWIYSLNGSRIGIAIAYVGY